jgi:hypothetical protein
MKSKAPNRAAQTTAESKKSRVLDKVLKTCQNFGLHRKVRCRESSDKLFNNIQPISVGV